MIRASSTLFASPGLALGAAMAFDLYGVIGARQGERQYDGERLEGLLADRFELGLDREVVSSTLPQSLEPDL